MNRAVISTYVDPSRDGAVALVSNALDPPPDEGIKKCAHELAVALGNDGASVFSVQKGRRFREKLLVGPRMLRKLRADQVRTIIYIPTQSATIGSLVRCAVLRSLTGAKVVLVALQPRGLTAMPKWLGPYFGPNLLLTPSPSMLEEARRCGFHASFVQVGVDSERFQPVSQTQKLELRRKYGLPTDRPVALHVGHARRLRGFDWFVNIGANCARVVVIGNSLGSDPLVVDELRNAGVHVIDQYLADVQEMYQLSDVYLFPVRDEQAAIAVPLSVLEAMSCNLPVVTTRFGGLQRMLLHGSGLFFAGDEAEFDRNTLTALDMAPSSIQTRAQVLPYNWSAMAETILKSAVGL